MILYCLVLPTLNHLKKSKMTKEEKNRLKADKWSQKVSTKYLVKPGCGTKCKRETPCSNIFSEDDKAEINRYYWSLSFAGRKAFILDKVVRECVSSHRVKPNSTNKKPNDHSPPNADFKKNFSYTYRFFKPGSGSSAAQSVTVCKSFFLETLGFNKENDSIISKTFKGIDSNSQNLCIDRRGKHVSRSSEVDMK